MSKDVHPLTTELHSAAYHGHLQWLKACLERGLNVDAKDQSGYTPLHWAADMGLADGDREEVVAALIQAGADVNAREGSAGRTVLMVACSSGNGDIVRQLVRAGAVVNARTANSTALIEAACCGDPEIVRLLLWAGADFRAKDSEGRTALDNALAYQWRDVADVLGAHETSGP